MLTTTIKENDKKKKEDQKGTIAIRVKHSEERLSIIKIAKYINLML